MSTVMDHNELDDELLQKEPQTTDQMIKEAKKFFDNSKGQVFDYNEASLEKLEPQKEHKSYGQKL